MSSLWPPEVRGGAELYASRLAGQLRAGGHEVAAFTLGVGGPDVAGSSPQWPYRLNESADQPRWRRAAFHLRDQYDPLTAFGLRRAIDRFGPDVVHSHSVQGLSAAVLTTPSARGVAHVHTLHDYWLLCQRTSMVSRNGVACASRCSGCRLVSGARRLISARHFPGVLVAVSEAVAEEHRRCGFRAERMRVIRNPVEGGAPRRGGERKPGPVRLGFLGQLIAIKGVRVLLEALESAGEVELVVAGEGPLLDEVAANARARSLGWVGGEEKERFFAEIDCLVVPSVWKDPAPLVVNETRARGLPVIAARIGGLPELVTESSRPLLFAPGDAADLAAKIRMFAAEPARFAPSPDDEGHGWDQHLELVLGAYHDARANAIVPS